jgi:hypothetical protein
MPQQPTTILALLNGTAAVIGVYITARAYRAYRRSGVRFMLVLSLGLGTLTTALVVEGFAFEILGFRLPIAHVFEAALNLLAFVILAASLHASGPSREERLEGGEAEPPGEAED